jgi:hypothetical protein
MWSHHSRELSIYWLSDLLNMTSHESGIAKAEASPHADDQVVDDFQI